MPNQPAVDADGLPIDCTICQRMVQVSNIQGNRREDLGSVNGLCELDCPVHVPLGRDIAGPPVSEFDKRRVYVSCFPSGTLDITIHGPQIAPTQFKRYRLIRTS